MTAPTYNSPFEAQFDPDRAQEFYILKLLRGLHTAALVEVQGVTPISDRVGTVQVIPVVEDKQTGGVVVAQSPIYSVPYLRLQGGKSAVILDPVVNDIGLCVFAERDITGFLQTLKAGPAPTDRAHSSADGLYLGGFLNGAPTQWVKFLANAGGIDINTPGALTLEGQTVSVTAGSTINMTAATSITLTGGGQSLVLSSTGGTSSAPLTAPDFIAPNARLNTHVHTDPQGGNVGQPHN